MKLLYIGTNGTFINEVPARDLDAQDIQIVSEKWGLSVAETEGLLLKSKLYKQDSAAKSSAKTKIESEDS